MNCHSRKNHDKSNKNNSYRHKKKAPIKQIKENDYIDDNNNDGNNINKNSNNNDDDDDFYNYS